MPSATGKSAIMILLLLIFSAAGISAQDLSLSSELEQNELWLGESVRLTLVLQGSDENISPELFIPGIRVEPLGGNVKSISSITSINGKVTKEVYKAYIYTYNLIPREAGSFFIPPIEVNVEGKKLSTLPLSLKVKQAQKNDDFKLELAFDREKIYIDEEIYLKISFLYRKSLRALGINIPELEGLNFVNLPEADNDERYEINVNGEAVVFSRDDRDSFSALSTVLVLKSASRGNLSLSNSTASFEMVTGYQRVQDFFGRIQNQEVYGRMVIPADADEIAVIPFPENNKPEDFFGLSGDIELSIDLEPRGVHIGDPLTLTLIVSGMANTDIDIPSLSGYLGAGVDIPNTRSSAKVDGNTKTIVQTIRINESNLQQIPPITFSYFNNKQESYSFASTQAVPIKVLDTRIVTSKELEVGNNENGEDKKVLLEKKKEGLYYNYSGNQLLLPGKLMSARLSDSRLIVVLLIFPPMVFFIIMVFTSLLPQLKLRLSQKADRKRALRFLKKSIRKYPLKKSHDFLKLFNKQLDEFLKHYGVKDDELRIQEPLMVIHEVLYGRASISIEAAVKTAYHLIDSLESGEAAGE